MEPGSTLSKAQFLEHAAAALGGEPDGMGRIVQILTNAGSTGLPEAAFAYGLYDAAPSFTRREADRMLSLMEKSGMLKPAERAAIIEGWN